MGIAQEYTIPGLKNSATKFGREWLSASTPVLLWELSSEMSIDACRPLQ